MNDFWFGASLPIVVALDEWRTLRAWLQRVLRARRWRRAYRQMLRAA